MRLIGKRLRVVNRQADGMVLMYSEAGVTLPGAAPSTPPVSPAWLALRPDGRFDRPLPPPLTVDQRPSHPTLRAFGDEWVTADPATGVRRFVGNGFVPLLRPDESAWWDVAGVDRRGRWLFRKPASKRDVNAESRGDGVLLVDPTIPDPTPKLPSWTIDGVEAGWDDAGRPTVRRSAGDDRLWALDADGWDPLPARAVLHQKLTADARSEVPENLSPATTRAMTGPATTLAATRPALGPLLLTDPNGTRIYGGIDALWRRDRDGRLVHFPLPTKACGEPGVRPWLIRAASGSLFLLNAPGRVIRLDPAEAADVPWHLVAIFTRGVPNAPPQRAWLDPAGRIDVLTAGRQITVLFPTGRIPSGLAPMMEGGGR